MQPKGTTLAKKDESLERWEAWLKRARRRPQVRAFAIRFTDLIEARVGIPSSQHVDQLAESAMREAGASRLTERQVREVFELLLEVWKYGLALRNWAVGKGLMN